MGLLVSLGLAVACQRPEEQSRGRVQVAMTLDNPMQYKQRMKGLQAKSTLPTDAKTVLILAMPANAEFQGDYTKFRDKAYDAALMNLNTKEVQLQLPLDTPLTLFEYTFFESLSLDQLQGKAYSPVAGTSFPTFRVQQKTDKLNLKAYLKLITPPKTLEVVALSPMLSKGRQQQLMAYGTYPGEVRQDVTGLVEWSSSDKAIAKVADDPENKGMAEALSLGNVTIAAKAGRSTAELTLMVTPGNDELGADFVELMTYGGYELRIEEMGFGLQWRLTETTYQPFEDRKFSFNPDSREWIFERSSTSAGGADFVEWNGSDWGPGEQVDFGLQSIDFANAVVKLNQPPGAVFKALNSAKLKGQTMNLAGNSSIKVPLAFADAASRLLTLEYSRPLVRPKLMLWFAENSHNGNYSTYADLASFLAARVAANDPLTCTNQMPFKCLRLESYSSGQTAGNLVEYQYDQYKNLLASPQVNGAWRLTGEFGPNILAISTPGYEDHGYQPMWSVYAGMVWRGGMVQGFERSEFQQFNSAAMEEIYQFFATAPVSTLYPYIPPSAGGSFYGGNSGGSGADSGTGTSPMPGPGPSNNLMPVAQPQGLNFIATQSMSNSLAQDFGISSSWTFGSTFSFNTTGPLTLFHLKETAGTNNAILVQITATYAVQVMVYDNTGTLAKSYTSSIAMMAGQTHHLAVTYDGATLRMYLDGKQDTSPILNSDLTLTQTASSRVLTLGADMAGGTLLNGKMHSLAIWDRALGASEVRDLLTNNKGEQWDLRMGVNSYFNTGLLHQYHFEWDPANLGADHVSLGNIALDSVMGSLSLTAMPHLPRQGYQKWALSSPFGGEFWMNGGAGMVNWNPGDFTTPVTISVNANTLINPDDQASFFAIGSHIWTPVATGYSNVGSYSFDPAPFALTAGCNYRILIKDAEGHWDISDHSLCVNGGLSLANTASTPTIDGTNDWSSFMTTPSATDPTMDDEPGYSGDDLLSLWAATAPGSVVLLLETAVSEPFSTSAQNGPAGQEGVYHFTLFTDTGTYRFGVAYNGSTFAIGANGADSFGSLSSTGSVGVLSNAMEILIPASELGNPTNVYGIQARFISCCVAGYHATDEIYYP